MLRLVAAAGWVGVALPVLAGTPAVPPPLAAAVAPRAPAARSASAVDPQPASPASPEPVSPVPYEETVLVTGSALPAERGSLPETADFVGAEELAARQATSLAEALAVLPGLTVLRQGPPGQATSVFLRGAESDQTLVLWNGVELNDPYFAGFNFAFLPVDGAARIEVVRSPASALYGSDAVGGVVQVLTASRRGATVRLEAGEDAYRRGSLAAGWGAGEDGRGGTGVHADTVAVARRGASEFDNGDYDAEDVMARLGWSAAGGALEVGLLGRAADSRTGIPFSAGLPSPRRRISFRESQAALPVTATSGGWLCEGSLSRVDLASRFRDPDDPFGFTAGRTDSRAERARAVATWRRAGAAAGSQPAAGEPAGAGAEDLWVAAGADFERVEVSDASSFGVTLDGDRQRTWGAFAQAHWQRGGLGLDAGLRRDDNDVYGQELSPRLGLVWRAGGGTVVRAAYGEGFRAPSLGELFFAFSGNPLLEPEESETVELALERRQGPWRLGLAAFRSRQRNVIDFDFATLRNVNIGRAESRGWEATAAVETRRLAGRLAWTSLDAEDLDAGLPLLRRPERSAVLSVSYRPPAATLYLGAHYVGARADLDAATFARRVNGGYTTVELAATLRPGRRLAPYARVENALDRRYEEALGTPAPGRTLIGGVAVELR